MNLTFLQCNSTEPSPASHPTPRKKPKVLKNNRGSGVNFLFKLKQVRTIKKEVEQEDNNSETEDRNPPVNFVELSQKPLFLFSSRTMASKDSDDECEEKSQGLILHYQGCLQLILFVFNLYSKVKNTDAIRPGIR